MTKSGRLHAYLLLLPTPYSLLTTHYPLLTTQGTLFCMAPEVILKKGHDAAADFWSYGVLIYEMVTGGPPFFSNDKQELLVSRK